jgi:hypothetical protein
MTDHTNHTNPVSMSRHDAAVLTQMETNARNGSEADTLRRLLDRVEAPEGAPDRKRDAFDRRTSTGRNHR